MEQKTISSINNALSFIAQVHNHGYLRGSYEETIKFLYELQLELPSEVLQHIEVLISESKWKNN